MVRRQIEPSHVSEFIIQGNTVFPRRRAKPNAGPAGSMALLGTGALGLGLPPRRRDRMSRKPDTSEKSGRRPRRPSSAAPFELAGLDGVFQGPTLGAGAAAFALQPMIPFSPGCPCWSTTFAPNRPLRALRACMACFPYQEPLMRSAREPGDVLRYLYDDRILGDALWRSS